MQSLDRPLAIVTGASRGIGRGIALELARTHHVIATYRGNREAAESLAAEAPGSISILQSDIASAADRHALLEFALSNAPGIDLLVNNAGIAPRERKDVLEAGEESFDELLATNLKGPHFLTQQVARGMVQRHAGRIIFISSISAFAASVNRADYCIAKAGLSMSAQTFATRLAPEGVLVFEIQPGIIATDMIAKAKDVYAEKIKDGLLPQRRMGDPSDIAKAVRAIADGLLDYCAGQVLHADGGFHLRSL
jgi:NAD(P)-dependent dehydrogenase (short-subunit alcohol dehydrogenase family)